VEKLWKTECPKSEQAPKRAPPSPPSKLQAHADLAVAYREMGRVWDALEEAAVVLTSKAGPTLVNQALGVVFDSRLARPALAHELSTLLFQV
jgi:hypothetical protein